MVHCRSYHAAARNAQQQGQWVTALQQRAAAIAGLLYTPATVAGFDATYKWGAAWRFGVNAEFRFVEAAAVEADQQWTDALALMQGSGVADAFAERWDEDLEHPDADQSRVAYQRVNL